MNAVSYSLLGIFTSVPFLLVTAIGGMGTLLGPIIGAFIIVLLSEFLRSTWGGGFPTLHLVAYGLILMIVGLLFPTGIVPWIRKVFHPTLKAKVEEEKGT